jgi:RNA polymerase sigma factor (sigma-70 family)
VWDDIDSFDPSRGTLRAWLTMRAKYLTLDRRRQLQRRQALAVPLDRPRDAQSGTEMLSDAQPSRHYVADGETLDGLLMRHEQQEQLRRALDQLPEIDRLLVYMRYFRLASTEELAARTGLTRRAIDTRLWRARKSLRDTLEMLEERARTHVQSPRFARQETGAKEKP